MRASSGTGRETPDTGTKEKMETEERERERETDDNGRGKRSRLLVIADERKKILRLGEEAKEE